MKMFLMFALFAVSVPTFGADDLKEIEQTCDQDPPATPEGYKFQTKNSRTSTSRRYFNTMSVTPGDSCGGLYCEIVGNECVCNTQICEYIYSKVGSSKALQTGKHLVSKISEICLAGIYARIDKGAFPGWTRINDALIHAGNGNITVYRNGKASLISESGGSCTVISDKDLTNQLSSLAKTVSKADADFLNACIEPKKVSNADGFKPDAATTK